MSALQVPLLRCLATLSHRRVRRRGRCRGHRLGQAGELRNRCRQVPSRAAEHRHPRFSGVHDGSPPVELRLGPEGSRGRIVVGALMPRSPSVAQRLDKNDAMSAYPSDDDSHVFLSYAREDRNRVQQLAQQLRTRGFRVWLDEQIRGADKWAAQLHQAIRTSRVFLLLVSPASMHSQHVENELHVAVDSHRPVVPVMIEDAILSPSVQLLVAGTQIIDHTDATATWQFEDVVDAIHRAQERARPVPTRGWPKVLAAVLLTVGLVLIVGAFGGFIWNMYEVATESDPFSSGDDAFRRFVGFFAVFFVGMVVAGIGDGLRRYARRR